MYNTGIIIERLGYNGMCDGVQQRDQRFSRLDLINGLDLVDKYLFKCVYRSIGDKQIVEIAKVLSFESKVIDRYRNCFLI